MTHLVHTVRLWNGEMSASRAAEGNKREMTNGSFCSGRARSAVDAIYVVVSYTHQSAQSIRTLTNRSLARQHILRGS